MKKKDKFEKCLGSGNSKSWGQIRCGRSCHCEEIGRCCGGWTSCPARERPTGWCSTGEPTAVSQLILKTEKYVWSPAESCSDSQSMEFTLTKLLSTCHIKTMSMYSLIMRSITTKWNRYSYGPLAHSLYRITSSGSQVEIKSWWWPYFQSTRSSCMILTADNSLRQSLP